MVLGQVISIIGTACLTKLEVGTSTALWATFLVIAGVGHGLGLQMPFTAIQVVLKSDSTTIPLDIANSFLTVTTIYQLVMVSGSISSVPVNCSR